METHPKPLKEEAKATESAVAKSDHKVSAEGIETFYLSTHLRHQPLMSKTAE